jgi:hypothetical protein
MKNIALVGLAAILLMGLSTNAAEARHHNWGGWGSLLGGGGCTNGWNGGYGYRGYPNFYNPVNYNNNGWRSFLYGNNGWRGHCHHHRGWW